MQALKMRDAAMDGLQPLDSVVSLKWPAFITGVGRFVAFRGKVSDTRFGATQFNVIAVLRKGRLMAILPTKLWISDGCVVSQYAATFAAEQQKLEL